MKLILSKHCLLLLVSVALISKIGSAAPGDRVKIGQLQDWAGTQAAVALDGELWSIESDTLHRTDADGNYSRVGDKGPWQSEVAFAELGGEFFLADSKNNLYRAAKNGLWKRLPKKSPEIAFMTSLDNELWAIDKSGTLFHGDRDGLWAQSGPVATDATRGLVALDGELWTLQNGTIRHSPKTGLWATAGANGAWKAAAFLAPLDSSLWAIQEDGDLARGHKDGQTSTVGRGKWGHTLALVPLDNRLWTFENDGTLFYTLAQ